MNGKWESRINGALFLFLCLSAQDLALFSLLVHEVLFAVQEESDAAVRPSCIWQLVVSGFVLLHVAGGSSIMEPILQGHSAHVDAQGPDLQW